MKKLVLSDIRGPKLYAGFRDDLRKKVMEVKRKRRVSVGPMVTLVFENRATVIFQVEEMCRVESLSQPAQIQHEVDTYNALLPDANELAATLFIELTSQEQIERALNELVGLQDHVWLDVGDTQIRATFDAEQFETDKLAAVQYLRFPLPEKARAAIAKEGTPLALRIAHPKYAFSTVLPEATRVELLGDLA